MKKRLKELWLKALRSGQYVQGDGELKKFDEYGSALQAQHCCLGVLCDVIVKDTAPSSRKLAERIEIDKYNISIRNYVGGGFVTSSTIEPIAKEVDIDGHVLERLMAYNDNGLSFEEIADVIEKSGTLASSRNFKDNHPEIEAP